MAKETELNIGDYVRGRNSAGLTEGIIVEITSPAGAGKGLLYRIADMTGGPDGCYPATQIRKKKPLREADWHGDRAWVIDGNRRDGYTLLVGGHSLLEALRVAWRNRSGLPLGDYEDFVVFADPEEFQEQQG